MQNKVLIVESIPRLANMLSRLVMQANLHPIRCHSFHDAKKQYFSCLPETLLCVLVSHVQDDAEPYQAIEFFSQASIPTIALSQAMQSDIRERVLVYDIVDYIGLENAQTADYLQRLIQRIYKNKNIAVVLQTTSKKMLRQTAPLLQRHGFQTFLSDNKARTQELLDNHNHIQLVMIDALGEPNLSEFIADIRKIAPKDELAVVGMAYNADDFTAAHFIKCGATDFFDLPFGHEEFLLKTMQMLEAIEHVALIRRTANQDYLTGLPNRRHFFYVTNKYTVNQKQQQTLALIDLDHFKNVNDTYGHDAGDAVLKHLAKLLEQTLPHWLLARFGGEEFCVYINGKDNVSAIKELEKLRETIEQSHVVFEKERLSITSSIGVAFGNNAELENLLSDADDWLYKAKREGRNRVYYDTSLVRLDCL
jgi:diguanylate cyclase (GGDEF)-like protein